MTDSDEENDIFEINDFTVVTPLEECSAAVEHFIQKWGLYDRRPLCSPQNWTLQVKESCTISFGENKLKIQYIQPVSPIIETKFDSDGNDIVVVEEHQNVPFALVEDLKNIKLGFDPNDGIVLQFGVREYLYVTPADGIANQITTEAECDTILGAIKLALHASRCEIPVIVLAKDGEQQIKHGYGTDGISSYNFSTVSLRTISQQHSHLNGLMAMFKEHINVKSMPDDDEIRITTRFHNFAEIRTDSFFRTLNARKLTMVPFGSYHYLPINVISVVATWKDFREDVMTENESHSDFDINHATFWTISLEQLDDSDKNLILTSALKAYLRTNEGRLSDKTSKEALGTFYTPQGTTAAFDKLTGGNAMTLKIGGTPISEIISEINGPMSPRFVNLWISLMFGDIRAEDLLNDEFKQMYSLQNRSTKHMNDIVFVIFEDLLYPDHPQNSLNTALFKAARQPSLGWKLAIAMLNIQVFENANVRSEPQLWLEFVKRLREKYENNEDIDICETSGQIDLSQCFFAQKLQLLQACVIARRKRYALLENATDVAHDEFFDAEDDFNESLRNLKLEEGGAQGRLKKLGNAKLFKNPNESIYVPITQDRSPMTEDMLDEQTDYLCNLNEEDRILAQLEPLRSDMMGFKAANPGCTIEDFLRWHSPKDFDESTGEVSERMRIPDNTWLKCWNTTKPVAVINQARLFNDTKLAEEVLELFENATIEQFRKWLKPIVFVVAFQRVARVLHENSVRCFDWIQKSNDAMRMLVVATNSDNEAKYAELSNWITKSEICLSAALHLESLFNSVSSSPTMLGPLPESQPKREFILKLVQNWYDKLHSPEPVDDLNIKPQDPIGRAVANFCDFENQEDKKNRIPERKEYILNWNVKRPSECNYKLPQRMYACLENEFNHICFSLGHDCNFNNTIMD